MLLPRIRRVFPLRQWCRRRTFADAVPKYSPKVRGRAVWHPGRIIISNLQSIRSTSLLHITRGCRSEHGLPCQRHMYVTTFELWSQKLSGISVLSNLNLKGIWQALWSQLSDLKFVQPNHVQAVYLPAWIVDAEVETSVWPGNSARVRWLLLSTTRETHTVASN
jgi:hypothetical protein